MPKVSRGPKSASINPSVVTTANSFFQDLPAKAKESFSLREAVTLLREPLQAAMAKGYSYQDLADILADQGIPISPSTLKNYVPTGKRQARASGTKEKTPRMKKKAAEPAPEPDIEMDVEPDIEMDVEPDIEMDVEPEVKPKLGRGKRPAAEEPVPTLAGPRTRRRKTL